jgi:hypothetical protein
MGDQKVEWVQRLRVATFSHVLARWPHLNGDFEDGEKIYMVVPRGFEKYYDQKYNDSAPGSYVIWLDPSGYCLLAQISSFFC